MHVRILILKIENDYEMQNSKKIKSTVPLFELMSVCNVEYSLMFI